MTTVTLTSSTTWTAPAGVVTVDVACWGEGGSGHAGSSFASGAAGGGGEYAESTTVTVTPGNNYTVTIGAGGTGTNTTFPGDSVTVTAHAGGSATGTGNSAGTGGTGSTNTIHHNGGTGGNGAAGSSGGGGGGSSAGPAAVGAAGSNPSGATGGAGGTAPTGGGNGGTGGSSSTNGNAGAAPGGGGGGGGPNHSGGAGAAGQVTLTYTAPASGTATLPGVGTLTAQGVISGLATLPGVGSLAAVRAGSGNAILPGVGTLTGQAGVGAGATLTGIGTLTAAGGAPAPVAVNQWAGSFAQASAFGTTAPELQSLVVALSPSTSVGGGSGTPTAGNWLFCLTGWNQDAIDASTIGAGDDIHSFWRPGNETTSTWAVSTSTGNTRTSIWYTPNLARSPQDVYVAPTGAQAGQACLVVEISGLGPWDTVTGINTNYAGAATSLTLALASPSAVAFTIAAVCGDSTTAGQAFAPGSWTALSTVTATNGTDHTCDAVLTSAFLPSTSGSISVNGTASSATDLSGVALQVLISAAPPIPATQNPNWPYIKFEAAFGGGFQTPADSLTWTDLTNRCWAWSETTGIQYQLGSIQATELDLELDNFDGALSSDNTSSPYYPNVVTGTPVRLRAALGTIGGVTVNRWYVIQRNAEEWPQQIDPIYRRTARATGTDIWSILSAAGPTPYRGEIEQDSPYAWWPMDDGLLAGGVQPSTLRNAAVGNSNVLNIIASPLGVSAQDPYTTNGADASDTDAGTTPSVAVYAVSQQSGWMYGDPQSSPQSSATGNPVTATPGSAAWQQSGGQGTGGSHGWFLSCNDTGLPALSGGITIEGWFNATFFGSSTGYVNSSGGAHPVCGQPYTAISLATLTTASLPVAILQLDLSGHLNLITYNGSTPTSHSVYSSSDLRTAGWVSVNVTLTTSTWRVLVNGGVTATASGSGTSMTSAWSWLVLNGDMGANGGGSTSSLEKGGNVALAHWMVFPSVLPQWRLTAHYASAITGFGVLPAPLPTLAAVRATNQSNNTTYPLTPDGSAGASGDYGGTTGGTGGSETSFTFSTVVTANAGSYTSGPSQRVVIAGVGQDDSGTVNGNAVWVSWSGVSPLNTVYTSASAITETSAATVLGSGDAFNKGFGASAAGVGVCQVGGGTGASPPSAPSSLGDTAGQRIERVLGYGNSTCPGRCIDPAPLQVQAATDVGGQQVGANVTNITQSDGGLLFVDNLGALTYWQKSHLASQYSSPVWTLTPTAPPTPGAPLTAIPYYREEFNWLSDPQKVFNAILISPFSPDGTALADITPSQATQVNASQQQYGAQPLQQTSYLQSQTSMQQYANWIFTNFGQANIRAESVRIDAAPYPAAFELALGINVGDLLTLTNWQIGGGGNSGTFRVTQIRRKFSFGGDDAEDDPEASVTLTLDPEPTSYWG